MYPDPLFLAGLQMLPACFRVHLFFWAGPQPLQQNPAKPLSRQLPDDAFFISKLKSVARTSLEFNPVVSTSSSMGFGSSTLKSP
jgi:hypothetical protein